MTRKLPPLNALRAFEAAARHLSFTKAAEELFVTQAAVSHQIKALEAHLGIPLFRRLNRRLLLTEAGQAYLPPLREAFDGMEQATRRLHRAEDSGSLRITAIPLAGSRTMSSPFTRTVVSWSVVSANAYRSLGTGAPRVQPGTRR